jgi:hypothetical protein
MLDIPRTPVAGLAFHLLAGGSKVSGVWSFVTWVGCGFLLSWLVPVVSSARAWIAVSIVVVVLAAIVLAAWLWRD